MKKEPALARPVAGTTHRAVAIALSRVSTAGRATEARCLAHRLAHVADRLALRNGFPFSGAPLGLPPVPSGRPPFCARVPPLTDAWPLAWRGWAYS